MYTPFEQMPDTSRIWIYQSDRKFTTQEIAAISVAATNFINGWTKHGEHLKGSFVIKYNQFLIIAVDESFKAVSGCSIDASIHFVKKIEQEFQLDLTDRLNVTFKDDDNINLVKLSEFQDYVSQGKITSQTLVFNNMIDSKASLANCWEVSADQSWHKQFLV